MFIRKKRIYIKKWNGFKKNKFSNNLFIFHNFVYKKDDNLFKQMKICIHERKGKFILRNGIRKTKFPKVVH